MEHTFNGWGHHFCLPPGTRVQGWLVESCHGHGAFGVVYRAVRVGRESDGPVALKVALFPWDPRFMREVALLSLVDHPSVPSLLGHGFWRRPQGTFFPFIVMQWVEGTPLYEWVRQHQPSSAQVARLLAQLARALEATHDSLAVHRDVKGHNVLVRHSDGRAMLLDFGAGNYQSAARLTFQPLPPGTPPYQSPEAARFERNAADTPDAHYLAGPSDDVFALGVTAHRLLTGDYPLSPEPPLPGVPPALRALILRMLSLAPEARGTAGELAEALEAVAAQEQTPHQQKVSALPSAWRRRRVWRAGGVGAFVGLLLAVGIWHFTHPHSSRASRTAGAADTAPPDEGNTGVAEAASEKTEASAPPPRQSEAIRQDPSADPLPGQLRPNERGQCPGGKQVPLNGGCWVEYPAKDAAECEANGQVFIQGRCYARAFGQRRKNPPTSAPADSR